MNVNSLPSFTPPCGSFASNTWRYTNSFSLIYRLNGTYISQRPVEHSLWHQQWSSNCPVIMPTNNTKNHLATFYTPSYLTSHCKPTSSCRGHGDWGPRTSAVLASRILHHCIVILEKPLWMFTRFFIKDLHICLKPTWYKQILEKPQCLASICYLHLCCSNKTDKHSSAIKIWAGHNSQWQTALIGSSSKWTKRMLLYKLKLTANT